MKRSSLNFILDLLSFVDLLCLVFTGFIMKYILPPGPVQADFDVGYTMEPAEKT